MIKKVQHIRPAAVDILLTSRRTSSIEKANIDKKQIRYLIKNKTCRNGSNQRLSKNDIFCDDPRKLNRKLDLGINTLTSSRRKIGKKNDKN